MAPVAGGEDVAGDTERIDTLPRYEISGGIAAAEPEIETLPPYEFGDLAPLEIPPPEPLPYYEAAPEAYARPLTHNELMRIFRVTHPISLPELYIVVFSGPLINPSPERTAWELRHFAPALDELLPGDAAVVEIPTPPDAAAAAIPGLRPLTHNELMRIFRVTHPNLIPELYRLIFSGPWLNPPPERTAWITRHFARMFRGYNPPVKTA